MEEILNSNKFKKALNHNKELKKLIESIQKLVETKKVDEKFIESILKSSTNGEHLKKNLNSIIEHVEKQTIDSEDPKALLRLKLKKMKEARNKK